MKITLAQTKAVPGNLEKNIQKHLAFVGKALSDQPDLVVFPELSLTGYEPSLAKQLAVDENHILFDPLQEMSIKSDVMIAVGMPIQKDNHTYIGMVIFLPDGNRETYLKQILHEDEEPIFKPGRKQVILNVKGVKVAPAICYESLQESHLKECVEAGAEVYLATVSKHQEGLTKAYTYYKEKSTEFGIPILMVNSVGKSDNFYSPGASACWNANGKIQRQLTAEEGILTFEYRKTPANGGPFSLFLMA